ITSPTDKQLITDASRPDQVVRGTIEIRAKIWDDKGVASATYQIDNGTELPLSRVGNKQMWSARWNSTKVSDGDHQISVNVGGAGGGKKGKGGPKGPPRMV
ncbi:MAG: Ig-like domain-containing protein, partial [Acidobacteriota bacterium]|nr:Ig-like domain-containing protein [Acidobacteriota bacterium]